MLVVNVYCKIRTLVKSVSAAFAAGVVAGLLVASGTAAEPAAPIPASSWVQR
ncbi:hypothetical protein [Amycolatopsis sp. WQ 127309]|uniref:hypothetical protein n=1 Tax=Amycolatopsis sp. WQ 127309 TaxID=2932773 RepID=UPI001FF4E90A|nr:hypothetical protein [Amycolatopsis sp. WQ 127309]UOZ05964.1 hypothetical protein MUY22_45325 [Amycolatopsis sp. WQ 127309]